MDSTRQTKISAPLFWAYSLEKYSLDEVKTACLKLQDDHAYNVNLLLFCMLCDSHRAKLSKEQLAGIRQDILLSDETLLEHRAKRKKAKPRADSPNSQTNDELYHRLLQEELTLEAAQQELIIASFMERLDASEQIEVMNNEVGISQQSDASIITQQGGASSLMQSDGSSALKLYFELMITSEQASSAFKEQQEKFIRVLGKHV
jgi:uncharacterized protein (TIGR02444 family)